MYFDQPVTRFIQVDALVMVLDQQKPKGFYFSGESHDFWEAVFVYDGHLTATADERVYQLSTGMLLLHKPMEFHRIWSAEDQESRFVTLSFRAEGMGIRRLEHCCFNLDEEQQKHLREVIDAFRHTMELLDSGMRASQVAESLDFSEASYFYTVFKRETGMTPTQYRKTKAQK